MTDKEKLIEEAAKAIDDSWGESLNTRRALAREAARAALAVFEKAHTPTDTTIPQYAMLDLHMALYGVEADFDAFYREHGYAEAWARLLAAVRELQVTPTDDEREALARRIYLWDVAESVSSTTWEDLLDTQRDVWLEGADFVIAAGFRRSEPTDDEREALVAILEAPLTEESQGRTFSEMLADVILIRFGFRRSEAVSDDEREARLEYVIDAAVPVSEFPSWRFRYSRRIADAVRAAGFRRSNVSEPPSQEAWRDSIVDERCQQPSKGYTSDHDREHGLDHLLVWAQEYARIGEPLKSAALIEAARDLHRTSEVPEPSAEEAQALEAVRGWTQSSGPGVRVLRVLLAMAERAVYQKGYDDEK